MCVIESQDVSVSSYPTTTDRHHTKQAGCSRAKAVSALKRNDGDIVNAIMELTV